MGIGIFQRKEKGGEKRTNTSQFMTGYYERDEPKKEESPHRYKVTYTRKYCIGGDICTFIDPEHFILSKKDGKADFIGAEQKEDGRFEMIIDDPTMNEIGNPIRRAADSCPAGVIRVVRIKDGKLVAGH